MNVALLSRHKVHIAWFIFIALTGACSENSELAPVKDISVLSDALEVSDAQTSDDVASADALTDVINDATTSSPTDSSTPKPDTSETEVSDLVDAAADSESVDSSAAQDSIVVLDSQGNDSAMTDSIAATDAASPSLYLLSFGPPPTAVGLPQPLPKGVPLYQIDVATGKGKTICMLNTTDAYPSSTFGRDGKLYGANNTKDRLDIVDPCTCKITGVGPFGYSFIPGITSDQSTGLFGMENTLDILLAINPVTGKGTKIGNYGVNFGNGGATWSDSINGVYAIDANSDSLYTLDPKTGKASLIVKLTKDFGTVGIELHPGNGIIYACTSDSILYTVDPKTGATNPVGKLPHLAACNNLAAPWNKVKCLEAP
ncbi:MAG TPA: hypothetical protein DCQ06_09675 [Myxococcales bacterium]|nr:hypothetical protein [Myxococcales bacterium]